MAANQPTLFDAEEWRDVPGWEGLYSVSNHGRVRSEARWCWNGGAWWLNPGRVMKLQEHRSSTKKTMGHLVVGLRDGADRVKRPFVHRVVLEAFIGPCPDGMVGCHNDGDATNNHVSNLRWDTQKSNIADQRTHGTNHWLNKTECPRGHSLALPNLVASAWKKQHRTCLACARTAAYVHRKTAEKPRFKEISDAYYAQIMK